MIKTIQSIGSISEHVLSWDERSREKKNRKLSEEIREERERLFGPPRKRNFRMTLPMSVKDKRYMIDKSDVKEMEIVLEQILSKMNEIRNTNFTLEQVKDIKKNKLIVERLTIGYVAYHCFHIKRKQIGDYFGMHQDVSGRANKTLARYFEMNENEQSKFLLLFDHFMTLNGKRYL